MKILVADDDAVVRRFLQQMLSKAGHDVMTAADGDAAWELVQAHPTIEVFLFDWMMPGRDGVDLCRAVRGLEREHYAYIILITSRGDKGDVRTGMAAGADDFLTKPVDREQLEMRLGVAQRIIGMRGEIQMQSRVNAELRHLDKLKSAFMQLIAHEVRSPLVVLDGTLRLLERESEHIPDEIRDLVRSACTSSDRLYELFGRTLTVSEEGDFSQAVQRREVDMATLVKETLRDLGSFSDRRQQALVFTGGDVACTLYIDADKIRDALTNLVMNAIKFTPNGGGIQVDLIAQDAGVRVAVTDSGMGIRPEDQPHVWDTYFSTFDMLHHSSGKFEYQKRGIGLGLAIVKQFVELHGGSVGFDNRPGKGTTFYFDLPGPTSGRVEGNGAAEAVEWGSGI